MDSFINFVQLLPGALPDGWYEDQASQSYRPELAPYNLQDPATRKPWSIWSGIHNSSYLTIFKHSSGARVRCKQYLYDLGPLSTSDHAALYDRYVWRMTPHIVDERIYWHGNDFTALQALTFNESGTTTELRVLEGELSAEQLIELGESLQPAEDLVYAHMPMAEKTYWSRYPRYDLNLYMSESSYKIPSSLWKLRWPLWAADHVWKVYSPSNIDDTMQRLMSPLENHGFRPDSTCIFGDHIETQVFLRHKDHHNLQGWLRQIKAELCPQPRPLPSRLPQIDAYSGYSAFPLHVHESTHLDSPIYTASVTHHIGPHDLIWWHEGYVYLLQLNASKHFPMDRVREMMRELADCF